MPSGPDSKRPPFIKGVFDGGKKGADKTAPHVSPHLREVSTGEQQSGVDSERTLELQAEFEHFILREGSLFYKTIKEITQNIKDNTLWPTDDLEKIYHILKSAEKLEPLGPGYLPEVHESEYNSPLQKTKRLSWIAFKHISFLAYGKYLDPIQNPKTGLLLAIVWAGMMYWDAAAQLVKSTESIDYTRILKDRKGAIAKLRSTIEAELQRREKLGSADTTR